MNRQEFESMMSSQSYKKKMPNPIDSKVVAERPCKCGGECYAMGFQKDDSYVVASVCKKCDDTFEF